MSSKRKMVESDDNDKHKKLKSLPFTTLEILNIIFKNSDKAVYVFLVSLIHYVYGEYIILR